MKFQHKLSKRFLILFLALLLLFGAVMLFWSFCLMRDSTISYNRNLYSTLYMKIVADAEDDRYSDKDIAEISHICQDFIDSLFIWEIEVHVLTMDGQTLYSSEPQMVLPSRLWEEPKQSVFFYDEIIGRQLFLSSLIPSKEGSLHLIYSVGMGELYRNLGPIAIFLLLFLLLSGLFVSFLILSFSRKISIPLEQLADSAQGWDETQELARPDTCSEITEIRVLYSAFEKMTMTVKARMEELKQQRDAKQRFIDSLTHEIRTPLTSIIGYASLLEKTSFNAERLRSGLHMIHENGRRIEALTESLTRLLSLEVDEIKEDSVSLRTLLTHIRDSFAIKIEAAAIDLRIVGDDLTLHTDRELFTIMVSNFLDNAIKAVSDCPNKTIRLEIEEASLRIRDTGKGIPAEDLDKIFEPFFMVDRSRRRSMGGFGLGLAISDRIRRRLDMEVLVQSEPDKGTCITILFPQKALV